MANPKETKSGKDLGVSIASELEASAELILATKRGDVQAVGRALDSGVSPNVVRSDAAHNDKVERSLLYYAAQVPIFSF